MSGQVIIKQANHACKPHKFQDTFYGKNKRLFNETADAHKVRCTVCGQNESYGGGS